ncbi:hypothetical protein JCM10003_3345 [Bacteroides pyogenes JCM 10003]|nr:hypothetical protein JCM10003_3345 [Bacteroides pyogenes JCM 10003]
MQMITSAKKRSVWRSTFEPVFGEGDGLFSGLRESPFFGKTESLSFVIGDSVFFRRSLCLPRFRFLLARRGFPGSCMETLSGLFQIALLGFESACFSDSLR